MRSDFLIVNNIVFWDESDDKLPGKVIRTINYFFGRVSGIENVVDLDEEKPVNEINAILGDVNTNSFFSKDYVFRRLSRLKALSFKASNENNQVWDIRSESLTDFVCRSADVKYWRAIHKEQYPSSDDVLAFLFRYHNHLKEASNGR
jgi:hypothetical protein